MKYRVDMAKAKMQPYADCEDCGRTWPQSPTTRQAAKDHTRFTGHTVLVVVEDRTLYLPDGEAS